MPNPSVFDAPSYGDQLSDAAYQGVQGLGDLAQDPMNWLAMLQGPVGMAAGLMGSDEAQAAPSWAGVIGKLQSLGNPAATSAARTLYDAMQSARGTALLRHLDPELAARDAMRGALNQVRAQRAYTAPVQQAFDLTPALRALGHRND